MHYFMLFILLHWMMGIQMTQLPKNAFFSSSEMRNNVPLHIPDLYLFIYFLGIPRSAISFLFQGWWKKVSCTLGTDACEFSAPLSSHAGQCERSFSTSTRAHLRVSTDALRLKLWVQGIEAGIAVWRVLFIARGTSELQIAAAPVPELIRQLFNQET